MRVVVCRLFVMVALGLGTASAVWAQFTAEELAERGEWETFLRTAEIVDAEPVGKGVTRPTRLTLRQGDVERRAIWKGVHGRLGGYQEGWQYEVAAYEMDKLLGLDMVPPTVARAFEGVPGSLQLWVEVEGSVEDLMQRPRTLSELAAGGLDVPEEHRVPTERMKYLAWAFASLIANEDLNQQNILYTEDYRFLLIDHSRSFRSSRKFTRKLLYGRESKVAGPTIIRELPRTFVERLRSLDTEQLREALENYLTKKEIRAIRKRQLLLLAEIDALIEQRGEEALY